jgi:hypothetical protein
MRRIFEFKHISKKRILKNPLLKKQCRIKRLSKIKNFRNDFIEGLRIFHSSAEPKALAIENSLYFLAKQQLQEIIYINLIEHYLQYNEDLERKKISLKKYAKKINKARIKIKKTMRFLKKNRHLIYSTDK